MGSSPDPPSFDDFQRQTSLMTSCTLLWKELSDHFTSLERDILNRSESIKNNIQTLDRHTIQSLSDIHDRELSVDRAVQIALEKVESNKAASLSAIARENMNGEVDNGEDLLMNLKGMCMNMDYIGFWRYVTERKKEVVNLRIQIRVALSECVDPENFVLSAISEVFPVDKRNPKRERANDLGWACVLILEALVPALVTPRFKERAKRVADTWKSNMEIDSVKGSDVHTFLQHLVTFKIFEDGDVGLYRKLVIGSAWRKQMPKLAVTLGLAQEMPGMIQELINKGQQVDAVHFTYEAGLTYNFPPVPLLKAFLKDAKMAAASIMEDQNNSARSAYLAGRKEQSALRAVIRCIEEYKLESKFPSDSLKKRLEQLEKPKTEKRNPVTCVPANKRTRATNGGPMPPSKAVRSTNAYVSSFPSPTHTFVRSPTGVLSYSPNPYNAYSPEAAYPVSYPTLVSYRPAYYG